MSNLTRYDSNGIELVINQETGAAYATQAGYSRMSGISYPTIKKRVERLKGGDNFNLETGEIQTERGFQVVTLLPANVIFTWLLKDNLALAQAMGAVGATVYLHQLAGFKVSSDAIALQPKPLELPPGDVRVANLYNALTGFGIDTTNPRYAQALQDITLDILGVSQPTLPPSQGAWVGAEQLGYSVALVASQRSKLGKYVKSSGLELRLCNGTQRMVNVYPVCPQLDSVIREFFEGQ